MSTLRSMLAEAIMSADDAIIRVQVEVANLNARIAMLESQAQTGAATQEDFEALAALKAKRDALNPTHSATLPPT